MGVHAAIRHDAFPKQYEHVGKRCRVVFFFDTSHELAGTVVRDDAEDPWETIIRLDDGRHVLATECQWSPDG